MNTAKTVAAMVAAALGLSAALVLLPGWLHPERQSQESSARQQGLPWQVDVLPDGRSQVFGLTLGHPGSPQASTLADVRRRWGPDVALAILSTPGQAPSLEAFVDPMSAGFVQGKLVVSADLPAARLSEMRARAPKSETQDGRTRKHSLHPEDEAAALAAPIVALAFIPQARLDADMVRARFGEPSERRPSDGHLEHWLYPQRGLDIVLDPKGKELMQYVAPAAFTRLRKPLTQAPTP